MQAHDMNRSYSMKGKNCVIRKNAEDGSTMPPERYTTMQPKPTLERPPNQPLTAQKYSALRMNASVMPVRAGDFKQLQELNSKSCTKGSAPTATVVREEDLEPPIKKQRLPSGFTNYPMPKLIPLKIKPTATLTRQVNLASHEKKTLLPLPFISQPPEYIPWTYPMDTSTRKYLTHQEKKPLLPLPVTSAFYQPWVTKPTATVTRQEDLASQMKPPLLPLPGQYYLPTPQEFIPWKHAPTFTTAREANLTSQEMELALEPSTLESKKLQGTIKVELDHLNFPISWTVATPTDDLNVEEIGEVDPIQDPTQKDENDATLEQQLSAFLVLKPRIQQSPSAVSKGSARRKRRRPRKQGK